MSIESVMHSGHLILCRLLLLLPPIPPSIRDFSNESTFRMRWQTYWSFSFSISPSNEHLGLMSFRMTSWTSLQSKGLSRVFSNTTVQKHQELSNLEVLQSPLEILEMHIPGTNTGDLIRNSYFPVQVHDISRWFWYSARAKNCYRVGLHSLRWKGRKTT